jgi:adenosylcobinamide-GDP ribazoletransferase
MKPLLFAFRYFTNLPVPSDPGWSEETASASLSWLPLTGLVVGVMLAALDLLCTNMGFPNSQALRAIMIIGLELWIGGAHFILGFYDSCSGLFSGLGPRRSMEIMKSSQSNMHGVTGLIIFFLAKTFLLVELSGLTGFSFMLIFYPSWTRWTYGFSSFHYQVVGEEGMAYFFKIGQKPIHLMLSCVFILLSLLMMPRYFYMAVLASLLFTLYCGAQVQTRFGGHTEETYGLTAICGELSFLFFAAITGVFFTYIGA